MVPAHSRTGVARGAQIPRLRVTKKSVKPPDMGSVALEKAVAAVGSQKALAERIGVSQGHVWYWLKRSVKGVPSEYVLLIESETGVSRHDLRPDIYPPPVSRRAAS